MTTTAPSLINETNVLATATPRNCPSSIFFDISSRKENFPERKKRGHGFSAIDRHARPHLGRDFFSNYLRLWSSVGGGGGGGGVVTNEAAAPMQLFHALAHPSSTIPPFSRLSQYLVLSFFSFYFFRLLHPFSPSNQSRRGATSLDVNLDRNWGDQRSPRKSFSRD